MSDDPFTSKADEEFFGAIGRVVLSWAQLELGLDLSILAIRLDLGGDTIEPEAPRTLQRKLAFLRKAAKQLPGLVERRDEIIALAAAVRAESEGRHDLIHGVAMRHLPGGSEAAMLRLLRETSGPPAKAFVVTTTSLLERAVRAGKLASQSLALVTALVALASSHT